ncbi:GNAT family N-acetyltransferase [Sphingosinicella humi]|uniref:GNAT family N-acetyltransferase n=1 Tax=Allosphingosinicella humi TaxID=2068657 RepID=A0A2U2J646_9SPHN|nr:GNAT family N-acetyltransferase [Sphingosinicella humi]PWG03804.1 GNAT family N-acetyltransferase [Sphingosinicella humi]
MTKSETVHPVRDNVDRKRFEIDLGDGTFAFADYNLLTGKIMFTHTEVPEAHEGQGLGSALIRAGLEAARERGLKVIPICPFFAAYMQKHAEEHDLLDAAWRARFGLESSTNPPSA